MKIALVHATLVDPAGSGSAQENRTIVWEGEKILAVGGPEIPLAGCRIIDLEGKYVLPGLINLHAHLFGSGKPMKSLGGGKRQERLIRLLNTGLGKRILAGMVKDHVRSALHSGCTTLRAVGDFAESDLRIRDLVNAGKAEGPRMFVSGSAITVTSGHGDGTFSCTADDPWSFRKRVREHVKSGVDLIKICVTGGVMDAKKRGEPGVVRMTLEETRAAVEEAHKAGLSVASHTESAEGLRIALEAGVDTIEHGAEIDDGISALFRKTGSVLVCTLSPAVPLARLDPRVTRLSDLTAFNAATLMESMVKGYRRAVAEGIPLGLGTDASCPFVAPYDLWRELVYFQKILGVTPARALFTATKVNSEILGIGEITGTLEAGKSADLLVVAKNPLDDLRALRDPCLVACRGRLVEHPKLKKDPFMERTLDGLLENV